jgi:hypothetical protein
MGWSGFPGRAYGLQPIDQGRGVDAMQADYIDRIVQDILSDMYQRKKDAAPEPEPSAIPLIENSFEELIQEEDEESKEVMRRIWKQLHAAHQHP